MPQALQGLSAYDRHRNLQKDTLKILVELCDLVPACPIGRISWQNIQKNLPRRAQRDTENLLKCYTCLPLASTKIHEKMFEKI